MNHWMDSFKLLESLDLYLQLINILEPMLFNAATRTKRPQKTKKHGYTSDNFQVFIQLRFVVVMMSQSHSQYIL